VSKEVVFTPFGGANFIGSSAYVFDFGGLRIGVDKGGNLSGAVGSVEDPKPLDFILLSHFHHDHAGNLIKYMKANPHLRGAATQETIELFIASELETVKRFRRDGIESLPFDEEDLVNTAERLSPVRIGEVLELGPVKIRFDGAGHTLGATSFNFRFNDDDYDITNDVSFSESPTSVVASAPKTIRDNCRLLVRESTYVNSYPKESLEDVESKLVEDCLDVLEGGGRVIIPSLSDRIPHVFSIMWHYGVGNSYPVYVQGAKKVLDVFDKYSEKSARLMKNTKRFRDKYERWDILRRGEPVVVIGTSGMLYPKTPSSRWVTDCLRDERSAVFIVNYQEPGGQGQMLLDSKVDEFVVFNDRTLVRKCRISRYNLSAHMNGQEGVELEERFRPGTIVYVHGEDREITNYIAQREGDKRFRRIKSLVAEEVRP
jgi:Cft2 family RNA processing exonuclease